MNDVFYVGIAGRAGSGKDPAAQVVAGHMTKPTTIKALAEGLKNMLAAHYGVAQDNPLLYTAEGKASPSPNPLTKGNTVRDDLIQLGDATRAINLNIWVNDMKRRAMQTGAQIVVVPDVRYKNEKEQLDMLIWVGPDKPGKHPTEAELTSEDATLNCAFLQLTVGERLDALREILQTTRKRVEDGSARSQIEAYRLFGAAV